MAAHVRAVEVHGAVGFCALDAGYVSAGVGCKIQHVVQWRRCGYRPQRQQRVALPGGVQRATQLLEFVADVRVCVCRGQKRQRVGVPVFKAIPATGEQFSERALAQVATVVCQLMGIQVYGNLVVADV